MSNLKVNSINDASGGSNAVLYGVAAPTNSMGFRNRIINGDMRIDQRNAGASVTPSATAAFQFTVDRFAYNQSAASKFSFQQNAGSVTPPVGYSNYLGFTSQSAYSVSSGDYFYAVQRIEGNNCGDFAWGTANAATVTLSFWVRSSLTGTFGGTLTNSAANRYYIFSYVINAANTWEQKTITIAGDTSGTWLSNNGTGIEVRWGLGSGSTFTGTAGSWSGTTYLQPTGSVNVVGTNGATFYITGVQLEAGSVASPFERRDYGRELMMCQRYYWRTDPSVTSQYLSSYTYAGTGDYYVPLTFPVWMRASPTVTPVLGSDVSGVNSVTAGTVTPNHVRLTFNRTAGAGYYSLNSFAASAEL